MKQTSPGPGTDVPMNTSAINEGSTSATPLKATDESQININSKDDSCFVPLPWFLDTIASLELCIKRNSVPIVCGPVGCGKTAAIDYLAKAHSANIFRIQISEQTDTKTLLGAYCCSNTPGVFIWRPGPLIHCMMSGMWLILEDVDKGSADLPILLSPILRHMRDSASQVLHPHTGEPVNRHSNFRLILTRRTTSSSIGFSDQGNESEVYSAHCSIVFMNGMPSQVIEKVCGFTFKRSVLTSTFPSRLYKSAFRLSFHLLSDCSRSFRLLSVLQRQIPMISAPYAQGIFSNFVPVLRLTLKRSIRQSTSF